MDVRSYNFGTYDSEKDTAYLFDNLGLACVSLNYKLKNETGSDDGEIDGVFYDSKNQLYIIYDDSVKKDNRQDKIAKFLNKWKDKNNQELLRNDLGLYDYPIYVLYIDKSQKDAKVESINYVLDEYTKIIYSEDYNYFEGIYNIVGKWAINDFYNFLDIKPKTTIKHTVDAIQIWVGETPALIYADRVENILRYCFISRRRNNTAGYQRLVEKTRVVKMSALIKANKINAFPNSILLNCVDGVNFNPLPKSDCPASVKIDLPNHFASCKVVDGQHRLLAFSNLETRLQISHSLPIVLFHKMSTENEIQTFIEINDSQKGIDPNLIYTLKADLNFQINTKEYREKLAVIIAKKLDADVAIFKNNIYFGNVDDKKKDKITLIAIVQSILENKIVDSNKGFLQIDEQDTQGPYDTIKEFSNKLISINSSSIGFYKTNSGAQVILKCCTIIHRNIEKGHLKITFDEAIAEFANSIKINAHQFKGKFGRGGPGKISKIIFETMKKNKNFDSFIEDIKSLK